MTGKVIHISSVDLGIQFLLPQLRAIRDQGYQVHVACGDGPLVPGFEEEGFQVHLIKVERNISPVKDLQLLARLAALCQKERFSIVHTHTAKLEFVGQLAARMAGTPIVMYTNHGFIFRTRTSRFKRWLFTTLARFSGWISDHTLSQSQEDIAIGTRLGLYKQEKISYLGNGIDLARFDIRNYTGRAIAAKRNELGIPEHHKVVGMVGRYVWEKGYRELFEAAGIILDDRRDVTFLTVGMKLESERDPVDFRLLDELGIRDRFIVLEARRDLPDLYAAMDVVVLPSYREGFPRTLMEASAMSRPAVATNISGCRQAIQHGVNGFLVPAKRSAELADRIAAILDDPALAAAMAVNGRKMAEEKFDQDKVVERLLSEYDRQFHRKFGRAFTRAKIQRVLVLP